MVNWECIPVSKHTHFLEPAAGDASDDEVEMSIETKNLIIKYLTLHFLTMDDWCIAWCYNWFMQFFCLISFIVPIYLKLIVLVLCLYNFFLFHPLLWSQFKVCFEMSSLNYIIIFLHYLLMMVYRYTWWGNDTGSINTHSCAHNDSYSPENLGDTIQPKDYQLVTIHFSGRDIKTARPDIGV